MNDKLRELEDKVKELTKALDIANMELGSLAEEIEEGPKYSGAVSDMGI